MVYLFFIGLVGIPNIFLSRLLLGYAHLQSNSSSILICLAPTYFQLRRVSYAHHVQRSSRKLNHWYKEMQQDGQWMIRRGYLLKNIILRPQPANT